MLNEVEEILEGKSLEEVKAELKFQLEVQGEDPGGNIIGIIQERITKLERDVQ